MIDMHYVCANLRKNGQFYLLDPKNVVENRVPLDQPQKCIKYNLGPSPLALQHEQRGFERQAC